MRNLKEVLDEQTSDEVVLRSEFHAIADTSPRNAPGSEMFTAVVVQAILERTAVVYPLHRVEDKRVVRLDRIVVHEDNIKWVPRNPRELRQIRARAVGQVRGRLVQGGQRKVEPPLDKAA